jgi:hypothetical protein
MGSYRSSIACGKRTFISRNDLVAKAVGWTIAERRARDVVDEVIARASGALALAASQVDSVPESLVDLVMQRIMFIGR